jgi:hypothetical protein
VRPSPASACPSALRFGKEGAADFGCIAGGWRSRSSQGVAGPVAINKSGRAVIPSSDQPHIRSIISMRRRMDRYGSIDQPYLAGCGRSVTFSEAAYRS